MQINITTDYAIRIVLYLAGRKNLTTSVDIASAMRIPSGYVLKITKKLVNAGILLRVVGSRGGFLLAVMAEQIALYDIIELMESTPKLNRCLEDDEYCSRFATVNCPVRKFYCNLQEQTEKSLKEISIADLVNNKQI